MADVSGQAHDRLLRSVAEQLKVPLLQIAHASELGTAGISFDFKHIGYAADIALRLVDGFLMNSHLHGQQMLHIEPVCVSAIMQDVAHCLAPHARMHNCQLDINVQGVNEPVMTHRQSLESIMTMLGYSLLESAANSEGTSKVVLGAHKSKDGSITAGIFTDKRTITAIDYQRARTLHGNSTQPLATISSSAAAGIFVADSLSARLETSLKVARHNRLSGLALSLKPSRQLMLV